MSRTYELMFILRPDLTEEQVNQQRKKYYDFLKEHGADKVGIKFWGKRRLAYPIQRFQDGIYILANYTGDGSQVAPIERAMRLSEEVIRYLTIKLKTDLEFEETKFNISASKPEPETPIDPPSKPETELKLSSKAEDSSVSPEEEKEPVEA